MRRNSEILIYNFEQSEKQGNPYFEQSEKQGNPYFEQSEKQGNPYFEQKDKVSQKFLRESVEKILRYLKKQQNSISLILVPQSEMKKKNYYWRRRNKATTVLTFSEGDIFLCPKEIKKQALKRKISQKKFYQLLLVHSILHLFGYTHNKKRDREKMENLEHKLLAKI